MKILLFTALFLVAQVLGQTNSTSSPSPSENLDTVSRSLLFVYYNFDALNNNAFTDLSSNGHNGQVVGNASLIAGKYGQAILLQNDLRGDQLVNAGAIDVNSQTFSVMAWVNVLPVYTNTDANMKIVSKKTTWDEAKGIELEYNPAQKRVTFISSGTNTGTAENVTLDNTWHHVAAVVNGTTVRIYVDGKDVTTDGDIDLAVANTGKEMLIGSSSLTAPAGGAWVGSIDEFRIYTVPLTASQLMWVMNGSDLATTQPSPSALPSVVPSFSASPIPSAAPSRLPSAVPTIIVVPVEVVSSAEGPAVASFIVVISIFFCIFMM